MPVRGRLRNALTLIRRHGLKVTAAYAANRLPELFYDWRFGIDTVGDARSEDLRGEGAHAQPYYPSDYLSIFRSFRHLRPVTSRDVFLDYGCGKGRVLVVAARLPFRRIVGVELLPHLADAARQNVQRALPRLACRDITVVTGDAAGFRVPDDVTVVFFYNPFTGPVLCGALDELHRSAADAAREITVVFKNPIHLRPFLAARPWLQPRAEFPASDGQHTVMMLAVRL